MLCCSCIWNLGNASYVNIHLSAVTGPTGDQTFLKIISALKILRKKKKPLDSWLIVSSGESALLYNLLRPHRVSYQMTFVKVTIVSVFYFYLSPPVPLPPLSMFRKTRSLKNGTGRSAFVTRRLWVTIGVCGTEDEAFCFLTDTLRKTCELSDPSHPTSPSPPLPLHQTMARKKDLFQ